MLSVEFLDCSLALGSRLILKNLTARFEWDSSDESARIIGLMGPSGSGKTTLAKSIMDSRYDRPIAGLSVSQTSAVISYLPQNSVLFPDLSVAQNARLLQNVGRYRTHFNDELFCEIAAMLRLETLLTSKISVEKVSGGEAQRLMLLRTLSVRPDLLILDEPATGLDPVVRESFLIDLGSILERLSVSALYISHHWDEIAFLCGKVAYADIESGTGANRPIRRLPILGVQDFQQAPPTSDAFVAVYGPGCSVVKLTGSGGLLAYVAPLADGSHRYIRRSAEERVTSGVAQRLQSGHGVRAALYRRGIFEEWTKLEMDMIEDKSL
jgi:ABC-type nitrate/sulfonate/bicarbonate transport system ATPase subunit